MRMPAHHTTSHMIIAAGLAMVCASCASYKPAPLSPVQNAQAIQARSLDDPRRQTFIAAARADGAAADGPVRENWNLATLILAALYFHPNLDIARADLAEARAGVDTARQRPNPSLSFEDLSYAPSAPAASAWTIAPIINFLIETAGKRTQRTAQA